MPRGPTPASLLPDSLRIFLALMMCPVKSRNGNNIRGREESCCGQPDSPRSSEGKPAADDMKLEINLAFCVLVVLTSSSQTRGQSHAPPPPLAFTTAAYQSQDGTSTSPDLTEDPGNELPQRTGSPAGGDEASAEPTTVPQTDERVYLETSTDAGFKTHLFTSSSTEASSQHTDAASSPAAHLSASPLSVSAADQLSTTPALLNTTPHQTSATKGGALPTSISTGTFSSQSRHTMHDASSTVPTTSTQSEAPSTATPQTAASDQVPAAPTHEEVPSQLKVGDEDLEGSHRHSSSPLDPLLAGLLSVFIVTTAIVFIVLFLKFRQRTNHPEFHRLQDLPMDDLMEDTPLSRYTY